MLYRYFGDKDCAIVAATDTWEADSRARLTHALEPQQTPRAKLLATLEFVEGWLAEQQWRGWLVADTSHGFHQVVARHRQAMRTLLGDLTAAGASDPDVLAVQVQVLLGGAMIGAILDQGPGPICAASAEAEILLAAAGVSEP